MAHTNFVVSGLSAYVEESRDLLIKNLMFGKGSREYMTIQTGIKYKENLHIFDVAPVFGDASDCGFTAAGTATLSQRTIEVAPLAVNMEICEKNLVGKYAEYMVVTNAKENPLPFEQYLFEGLVDGINRNIETMIWQGNKTTASTDPVKKWIDGFLAVAAASATASTGVTAVSIASGKTAYEGILAVYAALPENVLERGGEIFVSPAIFRAFMQDMVALNYFHYNPGNDNTNEFILPGTDVKVVKTAGLAGSLQILGTYGKNLVYGTDGENDEEVIDAWWSQDDRVWKIAIEFKSGVQIAFLDQVVLGTFAATPAATTGINASVASLADVNHVYKTKDQA